MAVMSSMGWIRRTSLKGQLLVPSLALRVHLVCMLYAGRLGELCAESLKLIVRRSKVFQMRQEAGLVLFLKAQHGITPQRERTLS